MGSSSVPQLLGKLEALSRSVGENRVAVEAAAVVAKRAFIGSAAAAGVGRGVSRSKVAGSVSARYDLRGASSQSTATVRYTGQAHLVNNPTKAHDINPRAFKGTRGSGKRVQRGAALLAAFGLDARNHALGGGVITLAGHPVPTIHHPGTKGLKFAQRAKAVCAIECPKAYRKAGLTDPLRAVFGN